ncbi:MAG: hypothetical protein ACE3L7_21605 [Candidatus Pristimantibacillus sp.]
MDKFILFILAVVVIIVAFSAFAKRKPNKRKLITPANIPIPERLGVRQGLRTTFRNQIKSLQTAIPSEYAERIKIRFLQENPNIIDHEYDLLFLELQRYFLMCSLLKQVPMFSPSVDEVWHTMIMYTREYDKFGHDYLGQPIHHSPADKISSDPHGRAWFDLLYTTLFDHTKYSKHAWGGFFRHPLDKSFIQQFQMLSQEQIRQNHFRDQADKAIVEAVILTLQASINSAMNKQYDAKSSAEARVSDNFVPYMAGAMIFYSMNAPIDDFDSQMHQLDEKHSNGSSNSGCSSSGSYCSSNDNHNNSSCSSSSCSSSSCGGGGGD